MFTPTFKHVAGYSSVDHFAAEIIRLCEAEVTQRYTTRAAARRAGQRILWTVKKTYRPSAGYCGPSVTAIRIDVDASR